METVFCFLLVSGSGCSRRLWTGTTSLPGRDDARKPLCAVVADSSPRWFGLTEPQTAVNFSILTSNSLKRFDEMTRQYRSGGKVLSRCNVESVDEVIHELDRCRVSLHHVHRSVTARRRAIRRAGNRASTPKPGEDDARS